MGEGPAPAGVSDATGRSAATGEGSGFFAPTAAPTAAELGCFVHCTYSSTTSPEGPSARNSPLWIHSTRSHVSFSDPTEWLTIMTRPALSCSSRIRCSLFSLKRRSPTARASSIRRIEWAFAEAIAKRRRAPIPDEYVFIGWWMNSLSSAKSAISPTRAAASSAENPIASRPSRMLFSPESSGTSAALTPSRTGRSRAAMVPEDVGIRPLIARKRVDFPDPLWPTTPMVSPSDAVNVTPRSAGISLRSRPPRKALGRSRLSRALTRLPDA